MSFRGFGQYCLFVSTVGWLPGLTNVSIFAEKSPKSRVPFAPLQWFGNWDNGQCYMHTVRWFIVQNDVKLETVMLCGVFCLWAWRVSKVSQTCIAERVENLKCASVGNNGLNQTNGRYGFPLPWAFIGNWSSSKCRY